MQKDAAMALGTFLAMLAGGLLAVAHASTPERALSVSDHLLGNTLEFVDPDASAVLSDTYLRADGTGWTLPPDQDAAPVPIRWFNQSDGLFCITRVLRDFPNEGECATYSVAGGRAEVRLPGGDVRVAVIRAGDAKDLEARATGKTPTRVDGAEAVRMLVGNTLVLVATGSRSSTGAFHLMPGGTMQSLEDYDSPSDYVGRIKIREMHWELDRDGRFCILPVGRDGCRNVSIAGDLVVMRARWGAHVGLLEKGDVRHLSPQGMRDSERLLEAITDATLTFEAHGGGSAAYYLGANGRGEILELSEGRWTRTGRIHWMFRPDRRSLCTFNARELDDDAPEFRVSNCVGITLSGGRLAFEPEGGPLVRVALSKGRPATAAP